MATHPRHDRDDTSTRRAADRVEELAQRRAAVLAHVARCDHRATSLSDPRPYQGPVAEPPFTSESPGAHGNVQVDETCASCGARRAVLINGQHREVSTWIADLVDLDDQLRAVRAAAAREHALDLVEARAWCGDVLAVQGTLPVRVRVRAYAASRHVGLDLDGVTGCYSIERVEATASRPELDDAQRTAWALIARRARRVLAQARRS